MRTNIRGVVVAGAERRRRTAVVAAVVALVVATVGATATCAGTGSEKPIGADDLVPWRDLPTPLPTRLARSEPLPDAHDCTVTDLGKLAWSERGDTVDGRETYTLLLPNKSDSRCTLRGFPRISATDPSTGAQTTVAPVPDSRFVSRDTRYPATIDSGQAARFDLVTCPPAGNGVTRYRDVALMIFDRRVPVSGLQLSTGCPLATSGPWYVLPPLLNVPGLTATIQAPAQVRRGEVLEYLVTVRNVSRRSVALDPCPTYIQRLADVRTSYRLNCATSVIAPHTSVRFAMRLRVPSGTPAGTATLSWTAVAADGRVVIADLASRGPRIEVLD